MNYSYRFARISIFLYVIRYSLRETRYPRFVESLYTFILRVTNLIAPFCFYFWKEFLLFRRRRFYDSFNHKIIKIVRTVSHKNYEFLHRHCLIIIWHIFALNCNTIIFIIIEKKNIKYSKVIFLQTRMNRSDSFQYLIRFIRFFFLFFLQISSKFDCSNWQIDFRILSRIARRNNNWKEWPIGFEGGLRNDLKRSDPFLSFPRSAPGGKSWTSGERNPSRGGQIGEHRANY